MKSVFICLLLVSGAAFAELMAKDGMSPIVTEAKPFKKECLDTAKATTVKEINVKNMTSESVDKKMLSDALNKDMHLTVDPKSSRVLDIAIKSTVTEKDKKRTTNYVLDMALKESEKELCKKTYAKQISEDLIHTNK